MLRALPATLAATAIGAAALFGGVFMGPSEAEAQAQQRGLVNVYIPIEDVTIQVPIAVAANLCDISVNVLAKELRAGPTTCDAVADADA